MEQRSHYSFGLNQKGRNYEDTQAKDGEPEVAIQDDRFETGRTE